MIKQRAKAIYVLIFAVLVGYFVYTTNRAGSSYPFRLGLDLSGGSHLVYKADVSKIKKEDIADSMSALRDDVERRVNLFGVSEPLVQTEQNATLSSEGSAYKLIVELPGISDTKEAIAAIGATPNLEFKLADKDELEQTRAAIQETGTSTPVERDPAFLAIFRSVGLDGSTIARASLGFEQTTNQPIVQLSFTDEGRKTFAQVTKEHKGDFLGIFLDGVIIEAPVIRDEIPNGQAQISGGFDLKSAQTLVRNINFGALPIPISLISEKTIGPTLGEQAVNGGIMAGIVSFIIIGVFLIIWYRLPGFIATVALAVYALLMLAIFKLLPVTLTAAGIAGFIITIGMAVDANILIFERMREELGRGRSVSDAMHEGFARAWPSIRDSNISSIITGIILYKFGSTSVITGFALVFIVGVLVSMFTAITASRLLLYAVAPKADSRSSRFLISSGFRKSADNQTSN